MKYLLDIWRQRDKDADGSFRTYLYETDSDTVTVTSALSELNKRKELADIEGVVSGRIVWECSCMQKKCGACAMLINGKPRLACDARLSDNKSGRLRIEPLRKFPLVADLTVNRQIIFDDLRQMQVWSESDIFADDRNNTVMYEASRCLQCGCCLEVCPNFAVGEKFFGMSAMVPASRLLAGMTGSSFDRLRKQYGKVITDGCGKSLACRNICPAGIDIEGLMARSNAAVLWKWFSKRRSRHDNGNNT